MENCSSLVIRTQDRNFLEQKLMALAMIVIFAILAPLSIFASTMSGSFNALPAPSATSPAWGWSSPWATT